MGRVVIAGIVAGIGLLLVVVGCILIPVLDKVVKDTVFESVVFEEGTDAYDNLVNPGSPTYTYFYFFNLTNADDFINNISKPIVEEIGPYVYRTEKPKEIFELRNEGTQILYQTNNTYYLEPDMSEGDPFNDIVVNVNLIVLSVAHILDNDDGLGVLFGRNFDQTTVNNNDQVFEPITVHDFLWGYTDQTVIDANVPDSFATNGLFYEVNNTMTDPLQVGTGKIDVDNVNEISTWKGVQYSSTDGVIEMWNSYTANMINGTDGTQYKPFLAKDDLIYTFSTDLCRSFKMLYDSEQDVQGINAYRFVLDPINFAVIEDNLGFCMPDANNCLPEGLLNVEKCYGGTSPLVASLPHMYGVDPAVQDQILGLNPTKSLHETAIDVEPTTGIAIRGNKRLQINFIVQSTQYFTASQYPVLEDGGIIFPVFWINEYTEISGPDAEDYKSEIIAPIELGEIITYSLIGVGGFILLIGIILVVFFKCTMKGGKAFV